VLGAQALSQTSLRHLRNPNVPDHRLSSFLFSPRAWTSARSFSSAKPGDWHSRIISSSCASIPVPRLEFYRPPSPEFMNRQVDNSPRQAGDAEKRRLRFWIKNGWRTISARDYAGGGEGRRRSGTN